MKNTVAIAAAILALSGVAMTATAQTAPASAEAAKPFYSVDDTTIGDLLDNAETKAILDKYVPGMSSNPQIDMARGMTLRSVAQYSPDTMTPELLEKIDAELAKVPAPKS